MVARVKIDFGNDGQEDQPCKSSKDPDEILSRNALRIVYQFNQYYIFQICDMIRSKRTINLRPEFQRRMRWNDARKSLFVESLMLNIPVPPVSLLEAGSSRYEVVDGQQRLNAIVEFLEGEYALSDLKELEGLNGMRFSDFSSRAARTFERATLSSMIVLKPSDEEMAEQGVGGNDDMRRLIFDRLNAGGRKLNAQELRTAMNPGPLNDCLIELSKFRPFTDAFEIPPYSEEEIDSVSENEERKANRLYAAMGDCELVLRFPAMRNPENIRGSIRSMLDRTMEENLEKNEAMKLATDFRKRFEFLYHLFDRRPFRVPARANGEEKISVPLYAASMVAIDRIWKSRDQVARDKDGVRARLNEALGKGEQYDLIAGRKGTADSVRESIDLLSEIFLPSEAS